MARRIREPSSPRGFRRALARGPIHLYRWHLGALLGGRVLLLTHTGRVSGAPRQVILEVVDHDPTTGVYRVASGFGPGAQWYRNVLHTPQVVIQVGNRRHHAVARAMTAEESGRAMASYAPRRPRTARRLMSVCGLEVDGSVEDYEQVGREFVPFVEITPITRDRRTGPDSRR